MIIVIPVIVGLIKTNVSFTVYLSQVRKIARHFRKSGVNNDKLQAYVEEELGKQMKLILDCRTRWDSMSDMVDRYILLHRAISKALIDIQPSLILNDEEVKRLKELSSCLKPVKMGVKTLCERGTTLLKADGVFRFILSELEKHNTTICRDMHDAIKTRFQDRRQNNIVSLYRYAIHSLSHTHTHTH